MSDSEVQYYAEIVRDLPRKSKYLDSQRLKKVCELLGTSLFEIFDEGHCRFQGFALLTAFGKRILNQKTIEARTGEEIGEFFLIGRQSVEDLRKKPRTLIAYVVQKILWEEEHEFFFSQLRKKAEFEIGSLLMVEPRLAGMCLIDHQKEILGYSSDFHLLVKPAVLKEGVDIPPLLLEIDENNHSSYDKQKDELRTKIIKAFGYRFIRVSTPRTPTIVQLAEISSETIGKLVNILSNLIIEYTPEINSETFIQMALENDIDKDLLSIMFPEKKREGPFFIHINDVARYLGYSLCPKNGYRRFIDLVKRKLEKDVEYEVCSAEVGGTKKGSGGHNKKDYFLSRLGFHLSCIYSLASNSTTAQIKLAKLGTISLDYAKRLRAELITNTDVKSDEKAKLVKDRIDAIKKADLEKTNIGKLRKENKELKEKNDNLSTENKKIKDEKEKMEKITKNSTNQIHRLTSRVTTLEKRLNEEYLSLSKEELQERCKDIGLNYKGKTKKEMIDMLLD